MAAPDIGSCLSAGIDGLKKKPLEHILAVVLVGAVGGGVPGLGSLSIQRADGGVWWSAEHGASNLGGLLLASGQLLTELQAQMDAGRRTRLRQLGFEAGDAVALSALHTRNFM